MDHGPMGPWVPKKAAHGCPWGPKAAGTGTRAGTAAFGPHGHPWAAFFGSMGPWSMVPNTKYQVVTGIAQWSCTRRLSTTMTRSRVRIPPPAGGEINHKPMNEWDKSMNNVGKCQKRSKKVQRPQNIFLWKTLLLQIRKRE